MEKTFSLYKDRAYTKDRGTVEKVLFNIRKTKASNAGYRESFSTVNSTVIIKNVETARKDHQELLDNWV